MPKNQKGFANDLFDWGEALVFSLSIVIIIFVFLIRLIGVQGNSMLPTLKDRDQLLISNLFYTPKYGDIVVLTKESFMREPIIKRIIATEGQEIDIKFDTGEVYVDDKILLEYYINENTQNQGDMSFPRIVPEGHVFVMGDNRNHSTDSRFLQVGMIDERLILGRVIVRILPFDSIGKV